MATRSVSNSCKHQVHEFHAICRTGKGVIIPDMRQSSCDRALERIRGDGADAQPVTVAMSVERGAEVVSSGGKVIASYKLKEIAFCFVNKDYRNTFAFIGKRHDGFTCNAFECLNEAEARVLFDKMSQIFSLSAEIDRQKAQLKQERLRKYAGHLTCLGISAKSQRPKMELSTEDFVEDPEEEGLIASLT